MEPCTKHYGDSGLPPTDWSTLSESGQDQVHSSAAELDIDVTWQKLRYVSIDTGVRTYCGPTAVAAITGEPLALICDVFRTVICGSEWPSWDFTPAIRATSSRQIRQVLRIFGYESQWHTIQGKPTLRAWFEERTGEMLTHPGIVFVTGHAIAFKDWGVCDTFSEGSVILYEDAHSRRSRVIGAVLISCRVPPRTEILDEIAESKELAKRKPLNARAAFVKLVDQMGAVLERDGRHLWVKLPSGICLAMRHRTWRESYANLLSYADDQDLRDFGHTGASDTYWFPRYPLLAGLVA